MASNHPEMETDPDSDDPILEWQDEAAAIMKDIANHVKDIRISTKLASSKTEIFLNVTILEEETFCIRVSTDGYQIVGHSYDTVESNDSSTSVAYETPYALLNDISPRYIQSFGNDLTLALENLIEHQQKND